MRRIIVFVVFAFLVLITASSQNKSLVNTSQSPYARWSATDVDDVRWTNGFWGHWLDVCKDTMVMNMLHIYQNDTLCHGYCNFEIAAGLKSGNHSGAPFHDGDFYKTLEAVISLYAITKDRRLYYELEKTIGVIAKAQREDGYIHTPTLIARRNDPGKVKEFEDRMNFETYNMGHLMTAACLHYRVTGQTNFLEVAKKVTDFLVEYHAHATPEKARNAICPSHYMGVVEMYRTTQDKRYLELAKKMIDIRGMIDIGTDDNQDRIPFRQQTKAMGHAVRANYLYAGVADLYAETGDETLMKPLQLIWNDLVSNKLYITGACGALYDGVSPNGTSYQPPFIQQVHQAYGKDYELPNSSAHNETCANIGNVLWNYRMLQITGDAKYADLMELSLYNSVLSGTDLKGTLFNYTNPLRVDHSLPYTLRWSKEREPYIAFSNCCPPNVVRTVAEVNNYAYSLSKNGIMVNLYGTNDLKTTLSNGMPVHIQQTSDYPWDGKVVLKILDAPKTAFEIGLRIPGWASNATIKVNGKPVDLELFAGTYTAINRKWKKGDVVELELPMETKLIESNPLVEETRGQVAIKRGPIVYCIESIDLPGKNIFDVLIPVDIKLNVSMTDIAGSRIAMLEGEALMEEGRKWEGVLYQEVQKSTAAKINIRLVPYFAWGNRGKAEMSVWIPVKK